ncbi:MAG: glycine cleavage system protein GcvH [Candidatus Aegiribacteria sp.]|nr:glycine cleavage system protein GcvH [Candidatus Aegiribacteria sp.]MBD3294177.1 glycine cleavage system protein GcvH [Candidatus Fermentibacteria bacterium]
MSNIPEDLRYTDTHEWVKDMGDGRYRMGLTYYAQDQMGEIVMVEFPGMEQYGQGDMLGALEAVKTAEDFYAPFDCEVVEINEGLEDEPALINEDCYEKGWLVVLRTDDSAGFEALKTAEEYSEFIGE